ncbi:MAG: hypothetical protein ACKPB8_19105, partial [Alphaproteobacteria bacterium]
QDLITHANPSEREAAGVWLPPWSTFGGVRGELPWFTAIAALPQSAEAVEAIRRTLRDDPASSARFRLAH